MGYPRGANNGRLAEADAPKGIDQRDQRVNTMTQTPSEEALSTRAQRSCMGPSEGPMLRKLCHLDQYPAPPPCISYAKVPN